MLWHWIPVAIGGACGCVSRYYLAESVYHWLHRLFPYGILAVNVLGSLIIGFLAILFIEKLHVAPVWRLALIVGFCGGFTTFSSFSLDAVQLAQEGRWNAAIFYVVITLVACIVATIIGMLLAREFV